MDNSIIGHGSYFHKIEDSLLEQLEDVEFNNNYLLLYSGRSAIKYLIRLIQSYQSINTIWFPNYYCPFVKAWVEHEFSNIEYYDLNPFDPTARINWSKFTNPEDIVFVNNYWGLSINNLPGLTRPIVVEDHSHGWLSPGCQNSSADFCFASLRKTVPLPLGGIVWKPEGSRNHYKLKQEGLYDPKGSGLMKECWETIHHAMTLKGHCRNEDEKNKYLDLYRFAENKLHDIFDLVPLDKNHENQLQRFIFKDYNSFKEKNLRHILPKLNESIFFRVLSRKDFTSFGLLLVFRSNEHLSDLKQYLVSRSIYPAELWPGNAIRSDFKFLLNIHVDLRYSEDNLNYFADCLNSWTKGNQNY